MSNLDNILEGLSPEQVEKIEKLANKFKGRGEKPQRSKGRKQQSRRPKYEKKQWTPPEEEESRQVRRTNTGGPRRKTNSSGPTRRGRPRKNFTPGKGQKLARVEPFVPDPDRPNNFDKMRERNSAKADTEKDKLLWGNNTPTERMGGGDTHMDAFCSRCKCEFEGVPVSYVYRDPDSGQPTFTCNDCVPGRK